MASGFLKGTLILTIAGFVVKAIGSINWILLSRILGGEGIGIYQMAFPIYLLLLQVSSAGVPIAISILTAERLALNDYTGAKRVFNISFTMLTITGLIAHLKWYHSGKSCLLLPHCASASHLLCYLDFLLPRLHPRLRNDDTNGDEPNCRANITGCGDARCGSYLVTIRFA